MSTITLEALTAAQRTALNGQAVITSEGLSGMARRFRAQATKARLFDKPVLAHTLRGYARLASDLAKCDARAEWCLAWRLARLWSQYPEATATSTPYSASAHAALRERTKPDPLARDIRYTRDALYSWFAGELPFNAIDDRELEQAA